MGIFRAKIEGPIPSRFQGIIGPVTVGYVPILRDSDGTELLGQYRPADRQVVLWASGARRQAWITFWHEVAHSWFEDTGASNMLSAQQMELVCDTVALGMLNMMEGGKP